MSTVSGVVKAEAKHFDVIVVGAGVGGLYALHRARRLGLNVQLFEAGGDVGGTWYWNNYPGARVDVPSFEYSFSFDSELEQEWRWSERYSAQPELLSYIHHVVERYDLRSSIEFNTWVTSAVYDSKAMVWTVETEGGKSVVTRSLIMATGPLSVPVYPKLIGMDRFKGESVHTGRWATEGVDVTGKRVAVIGTGSSGAQIAPELAKAAGKLYMLQRSPAYSVPSQNRALTEEEVTSLKANYAAIRQKARRNRSCLGVDVGNQSALEVGAAEREAIYQARWNEGGLGFSAAFNDIYSDVNANNTAAEFVRQKIKGIVADPETARKLLPDSLIGCKRLCVDNGYFEMFNRDNVQLIDISENPIKELNETGIVLEDGEIPIDVIVYATGFDAITGSLLNMDIQGRDGISLKQAWSDGPMTYLGLAVQGFPNLFMVNGPGSPAGLANMVALAEENVSWIMSCLDHMKKQQVKAIEPTAEAQFEWAKIINAMSEASIYPLANSWYVGSNVPGKPRMFMSHMDYPNYVKACRDSANAGYSGFELS
ncbi:NAD(P)/FAD-dependent oxidoreductase [Pseudomonas cavernicola]|uniref:NAD(P)/FAD-dependent oxidoreductase n=1 Tax=Pseudomonas cavernicola TaxID=2320866 RepID=A0A418X9G2_9PSED|nr:NAD(P)/FAD-dependent oxidoreductase [Pseudomonas cavernicola]RJG09018.1 NAD(P)/FAD-dependent oxidoreductase [Pseudomonas cavernicola]